MARLIGASSLSLVSSETDVLEASIQEGEHWLFAVMQNPGVDFINSQEE